MRILYLGDICGNVGLKFLQEKINSLRADYKPTLIFANAENTTNGRGLKESDYKALMKLNLAGLTMGNHTFRNKDIFNYLDDAKIARPMNLKTNHGKGYLDINYNGKIICVVNLIGSINMKMEEEILNPYKCIDKFLKDHKYDYLIVDFHAETTSEKIAMGYFLEDRADIVFGTHTHVQTSDKRLLGKKTLYLTDLGMCGPLNGVIGVDKEIILDRFSNDGLLPFKLSDDGHAQLNGALFDLDKKKIELIHLEK